MIPSRPLPISLTTDQPFPPEIIQLIIKEVSNDIGPRRYSTLWKSSRYSALRKSSLFNSTWRAFSDPELYYFVSIETGAAASLFLETAVARGGTLKAVRELHIEGYEGGPDTPMISRILGVVPHLVTFVVYGATVDVGDLAGLHHLRQLTIIESTVNGSSESSTLSLPSLRFLELWASTVSSSASHFLTPAFLPQLRHLEMFNADLPPGIEALIPQLEAIKLEPSEHPPLPAATSLRLVQLPHYISDRFEILGKLPFVPSVLSIDYSRFAPADAWGGEITDALKQLLATTASKPGLRVILLHGIGNTIVDPAVVALIQQLQGRAVRVVREQRCLEFVETIEEMERIEAEWKREAEQAERESE